MTPPTDADLRVAWGSLVESSPTPDHIECPDVEALWDAARGQLPPSETQLIVEHLADCSACAETWRLANEMNIDRAALETEGSPEPHSPGWAPFARRLAAAAGILLALALGWRITTRPHSDPIERGASTELVSLIEDDSSLPRDAFVLQWSQGPSDARYDLLVTTEDLSIVLQRSALKAPQFQVPQAALELLTDGATLLWRVEMSQPDGRHASSAAFRVRIK